MPVITHYCTYLPNNHTYHWLLTSTEYSNTQNTHASLLTKPLLSQNCRRLRSQYQPRTHSTRFQSWLHNGSTLPTSVTRTTRLRPRHQAHEQKKFLKMQIHGNQYDNVQKSSFTSIWRSDYQRRYTEQKRGAWEVLREGKWMFFIWSVLEVWWES